MPPTPFTRLELTNITAFERLALDLSPQVNVFVGTNGTGKTHLLKVLYAAGTSTQKGEYFGAKLLNVFKPYRDDARRLTRRTSTGGDGYIKVYCDEAYTELDLITAPHRLGPAYNGWRSQHLKCVYIPVKEVLAQAAGFRSLYKEYELRFDETHVDLIDWALKPKRREPPDAVRRALLDKIEKHIAGTVSVENEDFFIEDSLGKLEFTLLGEGLRKLALLWLLIQNGTLFEGSVLFWDEPEANLNPRVIGDVVEILLELARHGVQIFVATHDYVFLKELDLRRKDADQVSFHALFRPDNDRNRGVEARTAQSLTTLEPNVIRETYLGLLDREAARDFDES